MNLEQFPGRMRQSMQAYVENGQPTGDFLRAVLSNDLCEAFARADDENTAIMREYVMWIYNDVPHSAWGSWETVKAWVESGGLRGREQALRAASP
jgi:hypothetical protein